MSPPVATLPQKRAMAGKRQQALVAWIALFGYRLEPRGPALADRFSAFNWLVCRSHWQTDEFNATAFKTLTDVERYWKRGCLWCLARERTQDRLRKWLASTTTSKLDALSRMLHGEASARVTRWIPEMLHRLTKSAPLGVTEIRPMPPSIRGWRQAGPAAWVAWSAEQFPVNLSGWLETLLREEQRRRLEWLPTASGIARAGRRL